jgi:hypothetical protein
MKLNCIKSIIIVAIFFFTVSFTINPQQPSALYSACQNQIKPDFIYNGQPMRALLTGKEVAAFRTNNNLLFSSTQHKQSNCWDFKMEGNIECVIEAGLLPNSQDSGMALLMIGFKNSENSQ